MKELGYTLYVWSGPDVPWQLRRARETWREIYNGYQNELRPGIGIYLFRDSFIRLRAPIVFGTVSINPFDCAELSDLQKKIVVSDRRLTCDFLDHFCDAYDAFDLLNHLSEGSGEPAYHLQLADLSRMNLNASIALITSNADYRGSLQSAIFAVELALKALLARIGWTETELKNLGHDLSRTARKVREENLGCDHERIASVVSKLPNLVKNRYGNDVPDRLPAGRAVAGAQFVVGELARSITGREFRSNLNEPFPRVFPPKG